MKLLWYISVAITKRPTATYGLPRPAASRGMRLGEVLVPSDPENIEYLRRFIHSGYRLIDVESCKTGPGGNAIWVLTNVVAVIENRAVVRAWGTQRNITAYKRA